METHRLRWPGACQRSVDHPVLLDWARGSLPADVQTVGCGVENLDVLDGTPLHCRDGKVGCLKVQAEIMKREVGVKVKQSGKESGQRKVRLKVKSDHGVGLQFGSIQARRQKLVSHIFVLLPL